jgi:hypothetical protein
LIVHRILTDLPEDAMTRGPPERIKTPMQTMRLSLEEIKRLARTMIVAEPDPDTLPEVIVDKPKPA